MTHKPKDFTVNQKGVGVGSEEKIMVLALPSTFWRRETLAWGLYHWSMWPVLKMDSPMYLTLEAIPFVRTSWSFWSWTSIHRTCQWGEKVPSRRLRCLYPSAVIFLFINLIGLSYFIHSFSELSLVRQSCSWVQNKDTCRVPQWTSPPCPLLMDTLFLHCPQSPCLETQSHSTCLSTNFLKVLMLCSKMLSASQV